MSRPHQHIPARDLVGRDPLGCTSAACRASGAQLYRVTVRGGARVLRCGVHLPKAKR